MFICTTEVVPFPVLLTTQVNLVPFLVVLTTRVNLVSFRVVLTTRVNLVPFRRGTSKLMPDRALPLLASPGKLFYFSIPLCAIPILSRVLFFTMYIISSAWRITSCGVLASCG